MKEAYDNSPNNTKDGEERTQVKLETKTGISVRAVLISLIVLAAISYMNPQAVYFQMVPRLDLRSVPNPTALFVVIALMLINVLLRVLRLGHRTFSQRELVTVYGLVYIGGMVSNYMLGIAILPGVMGYYRWVYPSPRVNPFIDQASKFLFIEGEDATISFYLGQATVPWNEWIAPAITWSLYVLLIIFVSICMIYLVRRRWEQIEKLQYPLVVPVLELTKEGKDGSPFGDAWRNPLVWLGMAIPIIYFGINGLSRYVPIPSIPAINFDIGKATGIEGFSFYPPLIFSLSSPLLIGVGYMVPLQLLFSVWFFFVLWRLFVVGYFNFYRDPSMWNVVLVNTYPLHTGFTRVAMAIAMLQPLRHEIKAIVFSLFRKENEEDKDLAGSKVALIGFVVGMILIILFSWKFLFARLWWSICYFILTMSAILVLARVRAEMGLPFERHYSNLIDRSIFYHLPAQVVGTGTNFFSVLTYADLQLGDIGSPACIALEQYRMAGETGTSRKSTTNVLFIVMAIVIAMTWLFNITSLYEGGAMMTGGVYSNRVTFVEQQFKRYETHNVDVSISRGVLVTAIFGFAFTYFLTFMNARIVNWPFHPIGYVMSTYLPVAWGVWSHFFIAWVIKGLVMRYGGAVPYRKLKPFFMGLIIGSVIMNSFWGFVAIVLGY